MADATTELAGVCTGPGPCDVHPLGEKMNWVNKAGGLPQYIRAVAHAMQRNGTSESRAIEIAIGTMKNWAAGKGKVSAATRARAAKALAEWEALKARARTASGAESNLSLEFSDVWLSCFANMGTDMGPTHAGVVLKAADTGRVLMLQRALASDENEDPAAGTWEFPGGGHEDGDLTSLHTGIREFKEETGQPFPDNSLVAGSWTAPNGIYQGHIVVVPNEQVIRPADGRQHLNPDDPDGDNSESIAWWDPDDAAANPALRPECQDTPWDQIKAAGTTVVPVVASSQSALRTEVPEHWKQSQAFVELTAAEFANGRVYHDQHGWIPTDHFAASEAFQPPADTLAPTGREEEGIAEMTESTLAAEPEPVQHTVSVAPWAHQALVAAGGRPDDPAEADLVALIAAALTEVPKVEMPENVGGGVPFRIPLLLPTGIESGDRREFKAGSVESRDLPVPLYFQKETDDGHKKSVIVARIDKVEKSKNGLANAIGEFDTGPDAQDALRLVRGLFLRGVSADVDKIDAEMSQADDGKPKVTFSKGRLTAATLVGKPAFAECQIELPGDEEWESNMARLREQGGTDDEPKALVAAGGPMFPPSEWFSDPELDEPTHLTVTDEGRVFGHIASWEVDHIGMPFQRAPRSRSGYRYFATGKIQTSEGDMVPVGQLTLAGGHADLSLDATMAVKHYDDTDSAVADVAIGEDAFGIWVAGAARPELTDLQMRKFRAADVSGDWRPVANNLELVAALCVNCAGFPLKATARVASGGMVTALVAAGAPALMRATGRLADTGDALAARVASLEAVRRAEVAMELRATQAARRSALASELRGMVASGRETLTAGLVTTEQALDAALGVELGLAEPDEYIEDGDEFASDNKWIRKRGNKHVIIQKGTGKVISSHDTQAKAEAAFRGMMKSKYGS